MAERPRGAKGGAPYALYRAVIAWQWASPLGAENRVRLPLGKSVVEVVVEGECEPGEVADVLRVTFTRTSVALDGGAPIRLRLPRPVGTVANSYCDDDLRVSRGGRGGVFVLRRLARDLNDR